jgi:hypothetical protein
METGVRKDSNSTKQIPVHRYPFHPHKALFQNHLYWWWWERGWLDGGELMGAAADALILNIAHLLRFYSPLWQLHCL